MGLAAKRSSAMRARDASVPPNARRTGQGPCANKLAGRSAPVRGSPSLEEYGCASHRCPATVGPSPPLVHGSSSGADGAASAASILYTSAATKRSAFRLKKRSRKGIFCLPRWVWLSVLLGCTAMIGSASSAEQQLACTSDQGLHYITGPANDDVSNAHAVSLYFFSSSSLLFFLLLPPLFSFPSPPHPPRTHRARGKNAHTLLQATAVWSRLFGRSVIL